jgi:hypothetical protein
VKGKIASHSGTVLRELFCRSESMAGMKWRTGLQCVFSAWDFLYWLRKGALGGMLWNSNETLGSISSGTSQFWRKTVVHRDTEAAHMDLGLSISSQNPRLLCPQRLKAIKASCRRCSGTVQMAEAVLRLMDTIPPASIFYFFFGKDSCRRIAF